MCVCVCLCVYVKLPWLLEIWPFWRQNASLEACCRVHRNCVGRIWHTTKYIAPVLDQNMPRAEKQVFGAKNVSQFEKMRAVDNVHPLLMLVVNVCVYGRSLTFLAPKFIDIAVAGVVLDWL